MFYGQDRILRELEFLIPAVRNGENHSLLLVAPSGYGKTTLAFFLMNEFGKEQAWYYFPDKTKNLELNLEKRFHFIDEIHLLNSFEQLYPHIDSGKYTFVFATNEFGVIPEPLWRRCIRFIFEPYTDEEVKEILKDLLQDRGIIMGENLIDLLLRSCKRNPGYTRSLVSRLGYVFKNLKTPETEEELNEILEYVLNIKDGMTELDRRYLKALEELGTSSLKRISLYSRIPETVILRDIEPGLLETGTLKITSRGRSL